MTEKEKPKTPEQIEAEKRHAATVGAYQRVWSTTGMIANPNRNFRDLAEMSDFLAVACETCATKPPREHVQTTAC